MKKGAKRKPQIDIELELLEKQLEQNMRFKNFMLKDKLKLMEIKSRLKE